MSSQEAPPIYSSLACEADMIELVQEFVGALQERCAAMATAVQADNLQELTRLAHQLKGASGGYGFEVIGQAAAQLEQACKTAPAVDSVRGEMESLVALCRRASAEAPPA
jgi:HPt (histidine-containing phosphotransfer) domain-containing protein